MANAQQSFLTQALLATDGYKTYGVVALTMLVVVVHGLGWIDDGMRTNLLTLLGMGGVATLRRAITVTAAKTVPEARKDAGLA